MKREDLTTIDLEALEQASGGGKDCKLLAKDMGAASFMKRLYDSGGLPGLAKEQEQKRETAYKAGLGPCWTDREQAEDAAAVAWRGESR